MTTPTTDHLETFEEERLELRPARWQLVMMTLMPLAILGAFTASCWFWVTGVWSRVLAAVFAALGFWWAWTGFRQLRRTRVCADAEGVSLTDGSRRGYADQAARWNDVAYGTVEKREDLLERLGDLQIDAANRAA